MLFKITFAIHLLLLNTEERTDGWDIVTNRAQATELQVVVWSGEAELRDLSIIFYLQNIERVEMASFQIRRWQRSSSITSSLTSC